MRLGVITIVIMLVIMAAAFNLSKFPGFGGTSYTAIFADASGIHRGNLVQVGGIRVGRVQDVIAQELHGRHQVRGRPRRRVRQGQRGLDRGAQPAGGEVPRAHAGRRRASWREDTPIPLDRTESAYDIVGVFGDLTTTTEEIDRGQLVQALDVVSTTMDQAAPEIEASFDGIARLSETVASRDSDIQALFANSKAVTQLLSDRSEDLVSLMQNGDLVFQEVTKRKEAVHRLLVNARILADELRGVAKDNQEQIGPALAQVDDLLDLLISKEKELKATLAALGPYVSHPRQHHRHRPVVRRVCLQPGRHPHRRVRADDREAGGAMSRLSLNPKIVAAVVAALLVVGCLLLFTKDEPKRTVTAHFPRAVSVYEGTDVRILGVNVGHVTAVIPEGNSVRVEMEYDAKYDVPADAKAAIVTPTLVADRFVQLTPAFETGDKVMADGADIALPDTGVPVELDRIYASLDDLTVALGPNGVNKDGTLDHTLAAARKAFEGNGAAATR